MAERVLGPGAKGDPEEPGRRMTLTAEAVVTEVEVEAEPVVDEPEIDDTADDVEFEDE